MIRLFIASDYPVVRAGLRAILAQSEDCRVVGEGTLEEAESQAAALRPDVLLLELTGGEQGVTGHLRRLAAELPEVGMLVLSDDPGEAAVRDALQAGARGYLPREASPEELLEAVLAVGQGLVVLHPTTARSLLRQPQPQPPAAAGEPLTERELEVLQLLAQGLPSKTIASRLHISEHTAKFHVGSIMSKLGAASRTEAVTLAIRRGLIAL